jgi:hypothetical protein
MTKATGIEPLAGGTSGLGLLIGVLPPGLVLESPDASLAADLPMGNASEPVTRLAKAVDLASNSLLFIFSLWPYLQTRHATSINQQVQVVCRAANCRSTWRK